MALLPPGLGPLRPGLSPGAWGHDDFDDFVPMKFVGTLKHLALLCQASKFNSKFTNQIFKSSNQSRDHGDHGNSWNEQDGKNCVGKQSSKAKHSIVDIVTLWKTVHSAPFVPPVCKSTSPPSVRRKLRLWPCVWSML